MVTDASLLSDCPDFVSVGSMLKAHPQSDGGRRFLYFEASNEGVDQQSEMIMAKALADAAPFYLKFGNVDIDHYTLLGAKLGIPNYASYEVGRPVDVGQRGGSTFVKSEIFQGVGPLAEKANMVWDSLTALNPPQRWYPSVGGSVLSKSIEVDPVTQMRRARVDKVRWVNVGLSKTPVNDHVGVAAAVPMGTFAKALTAGYGSDSATLAGGGALRMQSLDGVKSYWDFRENLSSALRAGQVAGGSSAKDLAAYAVRMFGLSQDAAAAHVERFMRDLKQGLKRKSA